MLKKTLENVISFDESENASFRFSACLKYILQFSDLRLFLAGLSFNCLIFPSLDSFFLSCISKLNLINITFQIHKLHEIMMGRCLLLRSFLTSVFANVVVAYLLFSVLGYPGTILSSRSVNYWRTHTHTPDPQLFVFLEGSDEYIRPTCERAATLACCFAGVSSWSISPSLLSIAFSLPLFSNFSERECLCNNKKVIYIQSQMQGLNKSTFTKYQMNKKSYASCENERKEK